MKATPSNDSYIMHVFLFQLRTALSVILGASRYAKHLNDGIQVGVRLWLEKWDPVIERWYSAENAAHLLLEDGDVNDWEQVIHEMAENMKDVSIACAEGQCLDVPESSEGKMVFKLAMESGFEHLNKLIQPILNRDYHHLLQ